MNVSLPHQLAENVQLLAEIRCLEDSLKVARVKYTHLIARIIDSQLRSSNIHTIVHYDYNNNTNYDNVCDCFGSVKFPSDL